MITKEILLVEKVANGDGSVSMIAELCVYMDGIFSHHDSRSLFTFSDTLSDQDIIDSLIANEYSRYY
jgi:hypothetical protein